MNTAQHKELWQALHYCNMKELKKFSSTCTGIVKGTKKELIERICMYVKTGKTTGPGQIPLISRAKKDKQYPLLPQTQILFGAYKNDLKTRQFFKKLIGPHFHFTAFGIDWIKNRWLQEDPPTYQEFAQFWQKEYARRKKVKAIPKEEWAYIIFLQQCKQRYPDISKEKMLAMWHVLRKKYVNKAQKLLNDVCAV